MMKFLTQGVHREEQDIHDRKTLIWKEIAYFKIVTRKINLLLGYGVKKKVGFIGLGSMGFPMAENVLKGGHPLWIYNRTKEKAVPLLDKGARWAASPSELIDACDVVITMVTNDNALNEIVSGSSGLLSNCKKPFIHISMSTVSPDLVTDLEKKHQEKGVGFLAAPVSGRPERAKEGKLWILLAGESEAKKVASPILETMSVKVFDLGEQARQGALFKLCTNFMVISLMEAFSEAASVLEKEGIPISKAAEIWGSSVFDAPGFNGYISMLCKRSFTDRGLALNLGLKDMRLLQNSADKAQVPMPFLSHIHEKMLASMNLGRAEHDWTVIALLTQELAGLK